MSKNWTKDKLLTMCPNHCCKYINCGCTAPTEKKVDRSIGKLHYYTSDFKILCNQTHKHTILALSRLNFEDSKYTKCKNCLKKV